MFRNALSINIDLPKSNLLTSLYISYYPMEYLISRALNLFAIALGKFGLPGIGLRQIKKLRFYSLVKGIKIKKLFISNLLVVDNCFNTVN